MQPNPYRGIRLQVPSFPGYPQAFSYAALCSTGVAGVFCCGWFHACPAGTLRLPAPCLLLAATP